MNYYQELPLFNKLAEHYVITERMSLGLVSLWRKQMLKFASLKDGDNVLDIMCGDGRIWSTIKKKIGKSGSLTGIDYSQTMLSQMPDEDRDKTTCVAFQENHIESNSKDVVISSFGLKHLGKKDTSDLMNQIERVLKPGGKYALIELKMPKNIFFRALIKLQLGFFKTIAKIFCPEKKCSVTHLDKFMTQFAKTNYTNFYSTKTLTTQIKPLFGGMLLMVYGRKI